MSKNSIDKTPAPTTQTSDRPFQTDEQIALVKAQIASFLAHTNNTAVVRELETVLKSGRDQIGWKMMGRMFIEAFKEAQFAE